MSEKILYRCSNENCRQLFEQPAELVLESVKPKSQIERKIFVCPKCHSPLPLSIIDKGVYVKVETKET